MENTGERHIINSEFANTADYYGHLIHIASYNFAINYVKNKKVLDYGCGSGYGSEMLAKEAESVVAIDISEDAIEYAKKTYPAKNLTYLSLHEFDTQFKNQQFDVITSFQVIEHISNAKKYLHNLKSKLKPGGHLIITTPDKSNRLFNYIQKPWNIYHIKEYSDSSIYRLLKKYFTEVKVLKMTSSPKFVMPEILRRKKQKFITLSCTLFFYPNFLRVFLLDFQALLINKLLILKHKNNSLTSNIENNHDKFYLKYTVNDIEISENVKNSTDLLVICKA